MRPEERIRNSDNPPEVVAALLRAYEATWAQINHSFKSDEDAADAQDRLARILISYAKVLDPAAYEPMALMLMRMNFPFIA